MNDGVEYISLIVEPALNDAFRNHSSVRHAYFGCLAIYHTVDRVAYPEDPRELDEKWCSEAFSFAMVKEIAMHLKHGERRWVRKAKIDNPDALLITRPLGLEKSLRNLDLRSAHSFMRHSLVFVKSKLL